MKATSCSQCGSLIRDILPRQPIAVCDYCGAKVITHQQSSMPEPFDEEAAKFRVPARVSVAPRPPMQSIFIAIAFIGVFILVTFIISFAPVKSNYAAPVSPPELYKTIVFPTPSSELRKTLDDAVLKVGDKEKELKIIQNRQNKLAKKRR